jgi:hypothetical protein
VSSASRAQLIASLEQSLRAFTTAEYGRDEKIDDGELDQALSAAGQALRQVKMKELWLMKRLAAWRAGSPVDNRAWSR